MGIVNSCEKSTRQVDNEVYLNATGGSQCSNRKTLQQTSTLQTQGQNKENQAKQPTNKSNSYLKQHQENISPIQELTTEESKNSKSAYSKMFDKGLIESNALKVLKIEQNETKLLNSMYSNNLLNSTALYDCQRNRSSYSQHVVGSVQSNLLQQNNSYMNCSQAQFIEKEGIKSSRPSLNQQSMTRSTHSTSLYVANERKRVKEIYEDGSVYEGQVLNGLRDGQGTFTYSNQGAKYVGQWLKGNIEGYGILFFSDNRVAYEGQWRENKFNGNGVVYNENHSKRQSKIVGFDYKSFDNIEEEWFKYDGNFVDDQKDGLGTLYLKNGEKFVGNFHKDAVNGNGAFYLIDGTIILGVWDNNNLVQETTRIKSC
ncbi:kinase domain protein (macronuclear) [Tetrahymena thermophila SB210]|uniref:Kinase domain protein n=1 Tax=Tetrahymena thermophila (strain SB210) TaxID=312017 RepID=I7M1V4_TETTS|nr:kinase domain protein [Tetrahymena thermophila SB210]EAR97851.1 kinase domain protein [Tetrahymena thermophila SB210]|eukprot:XP_001018096.1 kinase domain protein [Tetrahymena thermophila SB210]